MRKTLTFQGYGLTIILKMGELGLPVGDVLERRRLRMDALQQKLLKEIEEKIGSLPN